MLGRKVIYLLLLLLIVSCSPSGYIATENTKTAMNFENTCLLYALPLTTLKVEIEYSRTVQKEGPYRAYADKFLGIKDVMTKDSTFWQITGVDIEPVTEVDPDHYYVVKAYDMVPDVEKLTEYLDENLLLTSYPGISENLLFVHTDKKGFYENKIMFTDLSVKRNQKETLDTLYKARFRDTSFVRIPVYKRELGMKTVEEKAKEAANFVIKIRKRRFKLLAGQYDVFPEGHALDISVRELNALEKEYLSMFMGKEETYTYRKTFYFTPTLYENDKEVILCRFSNSRGIVGIDDKQGDPLTIKLKSLNKSGSLTDRYEDMEDTSNMIKYRIPDIALLEIKNSNKNLAEGRYKIYQFGDIILMPVGFLIKDIDKQ